MKVAISFLGTGKYLDFLPKYYENIEKYFLPNSEKTILAFTDGELDGTPENLKVFSQEHLDWPYITLKRFEIINKAREIINDHDWFVFIDGDALVVDRIEEEEFFTDKPLFGVHHPCHYLKMPPHNKYPGAYEITENCNAAVDLEKYQPKVYYQGCFWGGKVPEVCAMIDELEYRVSDDLKRKVVALWHDESHLNKYFIENPDLVHTYGPEYAFPEVFKDQCTFEPKIVHLAKDNSEYQQ
jgi:hypothetical protein|tara:strand:+ start:1518 stop:2237 length:720 start_codon:yes stop_codon:yes gene_type:complete